MQMPVGTQITPFGMEGAASMSRKLYQCLALHPWGRGVRPGGGQGWELHHTRRRCCPKLPVPAAHMAGESKKGSRRPLAGILETVRARLPQAANKRPASNSQTLHDRMGSSAWSLKSPPESASTGGLPVFALDQGTDPNSTPCAPRRSLKEQACRPCVNPPRSATVAHIPRAHTARLRAGRERDHISS